MTQRPSRPGASPMRGPYLVRNRLLYWWLRANDALLGPTRTEGVERVARPLGRVLVGVGGHRGDAVMATALLASLQRAAPDAEIDVLTGSWNVPVFQRHPRVRRVHVVDPWQWNRGESLLNRIMTSRTTRRRAIAAIRREGYDAALDLSTYYPNYATLLHAAGIPIRAGFTSGGFGALYTHPVAWRPGHHVTADHATLLATLLPAGGGMPDAVRYELAPIGEDVARRVDARLADAGVSPGSYVLIHPGAGVERKEWPVEYWQRVAAELSSRRVPVVLTGSGARQHEMTRRIAENGTGIVDLCDTLEWDEFRYVIARARLVLTVDTVALHLAAADRVPTVAIMTSIDTIERWLPPLDTTTSLTHAVPCAPCYRSRGCPEMACVRGVTTELLLRAATTSLHSTANV